MIICYSRDNIRAKDKREEESSSLIVYDAKIGIIKMCERKYRLRKEAAIKFFHSLLFVAVLQTSLQYVMGIKYDNHNHSFH